MLDYYQILGVARDASPQVIKIAFEGKLKALADPDLKLSPAEVREEERLLREAFVTLSMAAKRGPYDAKLREFAERPAFDENEGSNRRVAILVAGAVAVAGIYFWVDRSNQKERVRLQEERIALDKETARKKAELEEMRLRNQKASTDEVIDLARQNSETSRMQRERAEYDRWRRAEELRLKQDEYSKQNAETRARLEKQREEDRVRRLEEEQRRQAQRDVDRQKEYLRRSEAEEERARALRHEQALREERERRAKELYEERMRQSR